MPPCDAGADEHMPSPCSPRASLDQPPNTCVFTLPAQLAAAWAARAQIRVWAEALGVAPDLVDDVEYMTSEAVSNAAEHAYPPDVTDGVIDVAAQLVPTADGRQVRVTVRDYGRWQPVDPDPNHRGHGLAAMVALAAEITIRHHDAADGGGTEVALLSPVVAADGARTATG